MTAVRFEQVSKRFGKILAVDHVSFEIASGELFFLLGPSGCGKTTLLRLVAGFLSPDRGEIYFDNQPMRDVPVQRRNLGIVFQHYALWPHKTVFDNIAYGLEVKHLPRSEIARRVEQMLQLVRLEAWRDHYPGQLSGGQQQRVAMARALVVQPRLLLLDEPLSNLDAALRQELRDEIRRIQRTTGVTTLYVTHDQSEALALADRLAVMNQGRILQVGTPRELYERPRSRFVATFLGCSNILLGQLRGQDERFAYVQTPMGLWHAARQASELPPSETSLHCLVRAEDWQIADDRTPNAFDATVKRIEFQGDRLHVELAAGQLAITWRLLPHGGAHLTPGHTVRLSVPPERIVLLFD